jgi:REP element-mobilizing transposase RayT
MKTSNTYIPSKLLTGDCELLRQNALTRWMSRDLMQAAGDFCRNLGWFPCYCECSPDHLARYLFWRLPQGACTEVRSGRTRDKFEEFEKSNRDKGWQRHFCWHTASRLQK